MVVLDSSVLINFLRVDRMNLLAQLSHDFAVTSHVAFEISDHYEDQKRRFIAALNSGTLAELVVNEPNELSLFATFSDSGRLGAGECSAIAVAINRGHDLALDDMRARRDALNFDPTLTIVGTPELMTLAIEEQLISVAECDIIKALWESEHRFKLNFNSFAELL